MEPASVARAAGNSVEVPGLPVYWEGKETQLSTLRKPRDACVGQLVHHDDQESPKLLAAWQAFLLSARA